MLSDPKRKGHKEAKPERTEKKNQEKTEKKTMESESKEKGQVVERKRLGGQVLHEE